MPLAHKTNNPEQKELLLRILLDQNNQQPSITAQVFPEEQTEFLRVRGIKAAFFLSMDGKTTSVYAKNEIAGELITTENATINLNLLIEGLKEGWLEVGNTEHNSIYEQIASYAGDIYKKRFSAVLGVILYAFLHSIETDDFSDSDHNYLSASQVLSLTIICHSLGWLNTIGYCTFSSLAYLFSNLGKFCKAAADGDTPSMTAVDTNNSQTQQLLLSDGMAANSHIEQSSCIAKLLARILDIARFTFNIGIIAWPITLAVNYEKYGGEIISQMSGDSDFAVVFKIIEALGYTMIMTDLLSLLNRETPNNWEAFFGDTYNKNSVAQAQAGYTVATTYSSRLYQALPFTATQPAATLDDYEIPTAVPIGNVNNV